MPPTNAPEYLFCTQADIEEFLSIEGTVGCADDSGDSALNTVETRAITQAIRFATLKVAFYCSERYCFPDLAESWMVNRWAVICACYWLSCRRGNPPPGSFDELYKEALEDMKLVHSGQYQIPQLGTAEATWPGWSNVNVNMFYTLRKVRVQRPISDKAPRPYTVNPDRAADYTTEF